MEGKGRKGRGKSAKVGTEGRGGQYGGQREQFKGRRDETKGLTSEWIDTEVEGKQIEGELEPRRDSEERGRCDK